MGMGFVQTRRSKQISGDFPGFEITLSDPSKTIEVNNSKNYDTCVEGV
jgi:hypothetical protein